MNFKNHPCFDEGARHTFARIHLPVAPRCNMQCNYCDKKFDCFNESRPGVTSVVLNPRQALAYLEKVMEKIPNISVVGIAGPGDPFANPDETMETLNLVRDRYPEISLCVATNGLALSKYVADLKALRVGHITVTVNAVDPIIGARIYQWARDGSRNYRGLDAALHLYDCQIDALMKLKDHGITVKINTVLIPGINDTHVMEVARQMSMLKADIMNIIPLYHVAGTPFENIKPLSCHEIERIRKIAGAYMPLMRHCARCRADAAGFIGDGNSEEIERMLFDASEAMSTEQSGRPYIAVASMEGILVNQHLGEADSLWIFGMSEGRVELVEKRPAPEPGNGDRRWVKLLGIVEDCSALLVSGIGPSPEKILEKAPIRIVIMEGLVGTAVGALLSGNDIPKELLRTPGRCSLGSGCSGTGTGCG